MALREEASPDTLRLAVSHKIGLVAHGAASYGSGLGADADAACLHACHAVQRQSPAGGMSCMHSQGG
jgi:hypothetical protein